MVQPLTRRRLLTAGAPAITTAATWPGATRAASRADAVRFGLTSVVVRENLAFFAEWARYLEKHLDRPVDFVQRRSYREVMELLESAEVHFAWICGYPYARHRDPEYLDLLAVPLWNGAPSYQSYVIVGRQSPAVHLSDLRGAVFAYSDPDSNSGYLVPRHMLSAQDLSPESLFRVAFFTYDHAETVLAVADGVADAGAVDSYVWEYVEATQPGLAGRTRVLAASDPYGFPPLVVRRDTPRDLAEAMGRTLLGMDRDPAGRALLDRLHLDGFSRQPGSLYDDIRALAERAGRPA